MFFILAPPFFISQTTESWLNPHSIDNLVEDQGYFCFTIKKLSKKAGGGIKVTPTFSIFRAFSIPQALSIPQGGIDEKIMFRIPILFNQDRRYVRKES